MRKITTALAATLALGLMGFAATASAAVTPTSGWQGTIGQVPAPATGCFHASYPSEQWQATPCAVAPEVPMVPQQPAQLTAPGPADTLVGDGNDYSAVVPGKIEQATGSFSDVSPGITEKGQINDQGGQVANVFTLQLNSQFFTDPPKCSGSSNPLDCQGWEQFVYEGDTTYGYQIFIQYWLISYDATCPSGWFSYSGDCYTNSPSTTVNTPLTAADLATVKFATSAVAGGSDQLTMSTGSGNATMLSTSDNKVDLAAYWNTAEFGIFGDGGGGQANFSANATVDAVTALGGPDLGLGSSDVPSCVNEGFTGETNNLTLSGTAPLGAESTPTIASAQTNGAHTTASCATAGPSTNAASAATSTITAGPSSVPANGASSSTITVQAKDAAGDDVTNGAATVTMTTSVGTLSSVTDNGDGTYTATLTSTVAKQATVQATINGQKITTGNPTVTFTSVKPAVTTVSPKTGPTSGGTAITITGTGFTSGMTVLIGQGGGSAAIAASNVHTDSPTKLTAVTGGGAKAGAFNVFVQNAGGTSTANTAVQFTYQK